ncbi:TM2 domain-containing protein [bacterium]|nr:TM2 domain-containing protein [bacterium]
MYCSKCGNEIDNDAVVCVHCGCQIKPLLSIKEKNWLVTLILCLCFGGIGAHRFYTGYIGLGILQIITFGGFGIWWLIDLIMILCRSYKTKDGEYLV